MKSIFRILIIFMSVNLFWLNCFSQVPFEFISNSSFNAERIAKYGVVDINTDFLEITNSTQFDNSFIPSIWAHQQSDNRFVLRQFATTSTNRDNGDIPIMIFRAELRDNLNLNAPSGGSFPWGTSSSNVLNRPLFAWENGNNQIMRILANGNVGIGTVVPTSLFHTNGTVRLEGLTDTNNPFRILGMDSQGNLFRIDPSIFTDTNQQDQDWLNLNGSNVNSIDNDIYTNGKVGINTTNPTATLTVDGSLRFENLSDSNNPNKILGTDALGNVFEFDPLELNQNSGSDTDWLQTDGSISNSINNNIYTNGKVGINTNIIPRSVGDTNLENYSLFVEGGILTEEVRVALKTEWADFVFKKNYNLISLEEVEKYIKANNHLKDVPNSEEVSKNGIELGEMDKILLQKIEELTLYIIELNKKVKIQKEEIEKLKSR